MYSFPFLKKPTPVASPTPIPYEYATLEDRFAERAMQVLLPTCGTHLDMKLEAVAEESYRVARFMIKARNARK